MSNQLAKFGAQPSKPVRYGVLWSNRFATGVWSQRSPLRDAASTRIEEEFYGARGDALIDGLNCEISPKLTFIRRPGLSVYGDPTNTQPAINRFYSFRTVVDNTELIHVLADCLPQTPAAYGTVRDVTPGVPLIDVILWEKSSPPDPYPGKTSFQSVGNTLYASDLTSSHKWVLSPNSWKALTTFTAGQFIVDPFNNLQLSIGSQTATIVDVQVAANVCTLFFDPTTPLDIPIGTELNLGTITVAANVPLATALSNTTQTVTAVANNQQVSFAFTFANQSFTPATGTATTGTGVTGSVQPAWGGFGTITQDGTAQWEGLGSSIQNWGIVGPTVAPTVTQVTAPSVYPTWAASTWYAPLFVIVDSNGNLQQLTTSPSSLSPPTWLTGSSHPTWATIKGTTTTDNNGGPVNPALWTCLGSPAWVASTVYAVGDVIKAIFTYYITVPQITYTWNGYTFVPTVTFVQQAVTATDIFQCTAAGTSGSVAPSWTNGLNTTVSEASPSTVGWVNRGSSTSNVWPGATQTLSLATQILDSNNNIESAQNFGESGTSHPTWMTAQGSFTYDDNGTPATPITWLNGGPFSAANTGAWIYGYSYQNSITGHISTSSPNSPPITQTVNNLIVVQGQGSSDPQVDTIVLWRTVQGGSVLFELGTIPNPGAGQTWIYTDTTPDTGLNELIEAPINSFNNPPPAGLQALTYHVGRIWGAVGNLVYFSDGPDVTAGNGNEAWSPSNVFAFPETVSRLFPTSNGLIVFTVSDVYIIQGLGTELSSFVSLPFLQNIGLSSYDAFAVNGSIIYLYSSDNQILTLDPNSGVSEIGFPIGDQFPTANFTPTNTQVTWHVAGSRDKGLYVSDFNNTWWRLCPTPAPESGLTWSPKAQIVGGFSAVESIETFPGTHSLLVGPPTGGGLAPILQRDYSVYSDNGSAYNAFAVLGSLVLAQPGQLALVESLTTDSQAVGTPLTLAVQLDEISFATGLATITPNVAGTGYHVNDVVTVVDATGTGGTAQVASINGGGGVIGLSILTFGQNFPASATADATTGGHGTGLTVDITSGGLFEPLLDYVPDPTQLEPSQTTYAQRFYLSQTQEPAVCRHLQIQINWGTDTVQNELLSLSLYGGFEQEK